MASPTAAGPVAAQKRRPRSRKSIAHPPSTSDASGLLDKENQTADVSSIIVAGSKSSSSSKRAKRSRSKSIGPGGLDALTEGTGNRRASNVVPAVKSILKPTIPLSPLKEIPSHTSTRKGAAKEKGGQIGTLDKSAAGGMGPPADRHATMAVADFTGSACESSDSKVGLKTEAEQQAAAREREEEEKRRIERTEAIARRESRRKSLANRRVSFAPEATLHTWDVVEYVQDSTTSSSSTGSTRRASTASAPSLPATPHPPLQQAAPPSDGSEPPSSPPEQVEDTAVPVSPAHQRDLHQRKRRRSSGIPPMNFNNPADEAWSSSPASGSSTAGPDDTSNETMEISEGLGSSGSDDSSAEDGVEEGESSVMVMDEDDITAHSVVSARSSSSTASSGRLDAALKQAAAQAGTQGIDFDENGDLSMEMADDEVTAAFKPWAKKDNQIGESATKITSLPDDEARNPFSPAFKAGIVSEAFQEPDGDEEMSMDITRAIGQILPQRSEQRANATRKRRKSISTLNRRSAAGRRRSSGEGSSLGDATMDLTMAVGGISADVDQADSETDGDHDEEMTMELTAVLGGVIPGLGGAMDATRQTSTDEGRRSATRPAQPGSQWRESSVLSADESEMDMTMAVGGILPSIVEHPDAAEDLSVAMDITTAFAESLPQQINMGTRSHAKALMELEAESGELASSPFHAKATPATLREPDNATPVTTTATATGSPSVVKSRTRTATRRPATGDSHTATRSAMVPSSTPTKAPATPSKQITPLPSRASVPTKTPPSKNISMRSASPKKLFKREIKDSPRTPVTASAKRLFQETGQVGLATPSIILTPRTRISSGVGADKEGLGSPKVAALLDRRRSIGDDAKSFTPNGNGVDRLKALRFEDPKALELEIGREREEEAKREDSRAILQRDAESPALEAPKNSTANLKDLIQSLTPKKKIGNRKSLAVGAAKGLLGKRPAELDDDEDSEGGSPKKLRGRDVSPVKGVTLPPPPSKTETTGRVTRATSKSLGETSVNIQAITPTTSISPVKVQAAQTPKHQGQFKDAEAPSSVVKSSALFAERDQSTMEEDSLEAEVGDESEEKIHLQDFLNMTSIRFMELTTTKRRQTIVAKDLIGSGKKADDGGRNGGARDLESCVVAGACTIPMLELYQHSCRELKKYISEGRTIVREIEQDTFEENPPLFREYVSASPDVRFIMDNQFKNVKTHARLLSKAMWYEWRMKLLEGLREGLCNIKDGMDADDEILGEQEALLGPVVGPLVEENERLVQEHAELEAHAEELANCDQEELRDARERLIKANDEIAEKKRILAEVQDELRAKEAGIQSAVETKAAFLDEIKEAERIREECRGWSAREVAALKENVESLERKHGWRISAAAGTSLTMEFRREVQLVFDAASLHVNEEASKSRKIDNSSIDVSYIGERDEHNPKPLTKEGQFFVQMIKTQLQGMQLVGVRVQDILAFVATSWAKGKAVTEEIRQLNLHCPTEAVMGSERSLSVRSALLLPGLATKIETTFEVTTADPSGRSMSVQVTPRASVVYGERFNEAKMCEYLASQVVGLISGEDQERGSWGRAVGQLAEKLKARGKK
ncbi:MAG: hypothetical protein M1832_000792 [Thelocarpon impressellum]|nr:MAG: hypothetical protein M1832_000792 [Thelocarpon impressellum]